MHIPELSGQFHSLNAKYMPAEEVARSFIPPAQWTTLTKNGHSLLVGPRGAGKTTLLKMLQPRALSTWTRPEAPTARDAVRFTGVFITADRNWSEQVAALGTDMSHEHQTVLGLVTFTTHVLQALAGAAAQRVEGTTAFRQVNMDPAVQAQVARETAEAWQIDKPVATFVGLQHAMADRITDISAMAIRESLRPARGRGQRLAKELPVLEYVSASLAFIARFNSAANEPDGLWCFLFDELELAPPSVVAALQRGLRGTDSRLLFKLSLAPYTDSAVTLRTALGGQQTHDFQTVMLSYPHKADGFDFCRALLASRLGVPLSELNEEAVFGRSSFDATDEERASTATAYSGDGRQIHRLRRLARKDRTFRDWLSRHDIDLSSPDGLDGNERAASLRRTSSIATVREAYRSSDAAFGHSGRRRRPRKNPELFTGATSLYAMAEGNPRWFMNLIDPLLEDFRRGGQVDERRQAAQIRDVMRLFRAVLTALPLPPSAAGMRTLGVLPVVDAIGSRLSQLLIDESFTLDPPGKFRVDDKVSAEIVEDLQFALNVGGIVQVPTAEDGAGEQTVLADIRGKTFRLAFLLAPAYPITLTAAGRTLDLSSILSKRRPTWDISDRADQLRLGGDEGEHS